MQALHKRDRQTSGGGPHEACGCVPRMHARAPQVPTGWWPGKDGIFYAVSGNAGCEHEDADILWRAAADKDVKEFGSSSAYDYLLLPGMETTDHRLLNKMSSSSLRSRRF